MERVVRIGLPHHRGLDHWVHRLCLAAALGVADESGDLRLRQSGGRGSVGIFPGRGGGGAADAAGDTAGAGERGGDHNYEESQGTGPRFSQRPTD